MGVQSINRIALTTAGVCELADTRPMGGDARIAHVRHRPHRPRRWCGNARRPRRAAQPDAGDQHRRPGDRADGLEYNAAAAGRQVIPANVAYIMDQITSNDNNRIREFGRNGYLTLNPRRVSAKTGTVRLLHRQPHRRMDAEPSHRRLGRKRPAQLSPARRRLQLHEEPDRQGQHHRDGEDGQSYPFSPRDLGITASSRSTRAPGLRPSRRHRLRDTAAPRRSGIPTCPQRSRAFRTPGTSSPQTSSSDGGGPGDDANFYLPGTQPGASTNCTYYGPVPLPDPDLHVRRTEPAPPPTPSPGPSPSPGPTPTPWPPRLGRSRLGPGPRCRASSQTASRSSSDGGRSRIRLDRSDPARSPEPRKRGLDMADDDVVASRPALGLVQTEKRPPVVQGHVGRGGEHRECESSGSSGFAGSLPPKTLAAAARTRRCRSPRRGRSGRIRRGSPGR